MSDWTPISDNPPHLQDVMLWLRADDGMEQPIGHVIAAYRKTEFFTGWIEKSIAGGYNTGIRQDLITHYKLLDRGPTDEAV
jgi:hypothetical protein